MQKWKEYANETLNKLEIFLEKYFHMWSCTKISGEKNFTSDLA